MTPITLIDQVDAGYTEDDIGTQDWTTVWNWRAHQWSQRRQNGGGFGDKAFFTFNDLPAGKYEVFATWGRAGSNATNTPFTIYDDTTLRGFERKNQQINPDDVIFNGVRWESLGLFPISSGTLQVKITDDANGYVMADAIRIARVQINAVRVLDLNRSLTDDSVSLTVRLINP